MRSHRKPVVSSWHENVTEYPQSPLQSQEEDAEPSRGSLGNKWGARPGRVTGSLLRETMRLILEGGSLPPKFLLLYTPLILSCITSSTDVASTMAESKISS